jgi:hypothetical protein
VGRPVGAIGDQDARPLRRWWAGAAPTGRYRPMAGTAAVGAVVHLLATALEEGRDLSSMSGMLADSSHRLVLA